MPIGSYIFLYLVTLTPTPTDPGLLRIFFYCLSLLSFIYVSTFGCLSLPRCLFFAPCCEPWCIRSISIYYHYYLVNVRFLFLSLFHHTLSAHRSPRLSIISIHAFVGSCFEMYMIATHQLEASTTYKICRRAHHIP